MIIKEATEEMCGKLAKLKLAIWETTYKNIYPKEKFSNYDFDKESDKFKKLVFDPERRLFVGIEDDKIVGYMALGKPLRQFKEYENEITLLYILKDYQKKGFGKQFFNFGYDILKNSGVKEFVISCNKFNINALEFYKKMGGQIIHIDEDFEDKSQSQIKLHYQIK